MTERPDPMRAPGVLVHMRGPLRDAGDAAAVVAAQLGRSQTDIAATLRRCHGFWESGVDLATTDALAQALRAAGMPWYALSAAQVPRPPKPMVARGVDPRPDDAMLAPVALSGPAEAIPYTAILAAVPVVFQTTSVRAAAAPTTKGTSVAGVAMSLATTGGLNLLMKRPGGGASPDAAEAVTDGREMLAMVVLRGPGQWQRFHVFADRCDYRVLPSPGSSTASNWRELLALVAARLRPQQAGAAMLKQVIAGGAGPGPLVVDDDNVLADRLRWLLMSTMLRRMGASDGFA